MADQRVVLVTGVADYWGRRVACRLVAEPTNHVIGIDSVAPEADISGLDFIQADVRNPILDELLSSEGVEAVIHLKFDERPEPDDAAYDLNNSGTKNVLGACRKVGIDKIIVKSSTYVYGAKANNPSFLRENAALKANRKYGYIRDWLDLEAYYDGFLRRYPDLQLAILRFANIVGPTADTPMTRFLQLRLPRTLLGFDPMVQIIHEDDVIDALVCALDSDLSGPCNVGATDAMPLSRLLRLAGRVPIGLFHRFAFRGFDLLEGSLISATHFVPIELDYLQYRCVADLSRMEQELSFSPTYRAEEAISEHRGGRRLERDSDSSESPAYDVEGLRETLRLRQN